MTYAAAPQAPVSGPTPLSQPLYGASFGQAFARFWRKYVTFSGRASRSEFWFWYLAHFLIVTAITVFMIVGAFAGMTTDPLTGRNEPGPLLGVGALLFVLWQLATLIPMIALSWRRLHDANLAGPFWFLGLIAGIGGIAVLVLCALPSNPAGARFDR
ncbi:hypothetical protein A9Z40_00495 [Microbacterium arborescens]|uniref:DUF805 domain-containing protein n=1 Tax=Microbacterium arborescens TaxID=33883 RepID=A0ABX2WN15_9MICO|nr:DUF805 domain-containing protein [Microbacterium arborescens]OAZ45628.1 hypothetical protein A9Z40_00495 [Microbacterium arborescens]